MTCMERLIEQAKIIKDINPDTKIWVYRESVAAQPWCVVLEPQEMVGGSCTKFDPTLCRNSVSYLPRFSCDVLFE